MRSARTRELPGNYPFAVKESLIRDFWTEWRAFVLRCFAKVQDILDAHVTKLVEKHFGAYVHGGLLQAVKYVVSVL